MKKRRTKVLLTLLAMLAVGFATTNAYIFRVDNWDPFGTLNLSNLIIKASPTSNTGMELSGYKIRIKTENGQLNVHKICDENGDHCTNVESIYNGGGGGDGITANGNTGEYCLLNTDGNLTCDNSSMLTIIAGLIANIPDSNTWEPNTKYTGGYVEAPGDNNTGKVRKVGPNGEPGWFIDATSDGNGNAEGEANHRCKWMCNEGSITVTWNCSNNTECINTQNKYHNQEKCEDETDETHCKDFIKAVEEQHGDRLSYTTNNNGSQCSVQCYEDEPTGGDSNYTLPVATDTDLGGIKVGYTTDESNKIYGVKLDGDGNAFVQVPRNPGNGGSSNATGTHGKRCRYSCKTVVIDGEPMEVNLANWPTIAALLYNKNSGETHTIEWADCEIVCDQNAPSAPTISIDGSIGYLCTKLDDDTLDCSTDPESLGGSTTINGGDSFRKTGNYNNTTMTTLITPRPLYFTTNFYHSDSFNFFTKQNGQYGAATRVTFDAKGIRLGNGNQFFSGAGISVAGTIVAGNTSTDNFIYIYATGLNNQYDSKHFEIMGSKELAIGAHSGAYLYFNNDNEGRNYSVGINKTQPTATLDIAGSIRISNNCAGSSNTAKVFYCDSSHYSDNKGTMMFYNNRFYGCMKSGSVYGRYDLAGGGYYDNVITTDCGYNSYLSRQAIANYTYPDEL